MVLVISEKWYFKWFTTVNKFFKNKMLKRYSLFENKIVKQL